MWIKVIKSIFTFIRSFLPCTSTPAFLIVFLFFFCFPGFLVSANIISAGVLPLNCQFLTFALLIYFLFLHFQLEVRQLYWQLAGHTIAIFLNLSSLLCISILLAISIQVRLLCTRHQTGTCWVFYIFLMLLYPYEEQARECRLGLRHWFTSSILQLSACDHLTV